MRVGERELLRGRKAELLDRVRPLDREQRALAGEVAHVRAGYLAFLEPPEVGSEVPGVDDEQVPELAEPVRDQVVDDAAPLVRQERVLRLARLDPVEVVRDEPLQELVRPRPLDLELSHVRHVEHACVGTHRPVLLDHARVLDGHLPSGERDHPRAEGDVTVVERRALKRLRHALPILVTTRTARTQCRRVCAG